MAAEFCKTCKVGTRKGCRTCPKNTDPVKLMHQMGMIEQKPLPVYEQITFMARQYRVTEETEEYW